jgi:1-deoxy-D-xylulose-5-phosphate reductoisomerase
MAAMTFEVPDFQRFPCLQLAWDSLRAPSGTCAVLNAANEVAVAAFLDRRIRFDQIQHILLATLAAVVPSKPQTLEDLLALDAQTRAVAQQAASRLST